ncbi:MAG: hypothetical protein H7099_17525 [Gemmatimonadaceae bacterium]|nr:hypothetical protein [Gemmatimonadaceae bacterium]
MTLLPSGFVPEVTGRVLRGRLQRWLIDTPTDAASGDVVVLTNLTLELRSLDDATQLLAPVPGALHVALSAQYTLARGKPAAIYVSQFTAPLSLPGEVLAIEHWEIDGVADVRRSRVPVTGV